MHTIGFPGLGIEGFELDPKAFEIFGISIQWYGIAIAAALIAGFIVFYAITVKKEGLESDHVYNVTLFAIPASVIGSRLFYVILHIEKYDDKGFADIINLRNGGISFAGALIIGIAVVLIYSKIKKLRALLLLDAAAPALVVGLAIGSFGNFVNADGYGWTPGIEALPWRMELDKVVIDGIVQTDKSFVHPSFLYQLIWCVACLVLLLLLYRSKKFRGEIFYTAALLFGVFEVFIQYINADGSNAEISVAASVFTAIAGIIGLAVCSKNHRIIQKNEQEYKSAFSAALLAVRSEQDALDGSVFDNCNEQKDENGDNNNDAD